MSILMKRVHFMRRFERITMAEALRACWRLWKADREDYRRMECGYCGGCY